MQCGLGQAYQDVYLDLRKMQCYVGVHRCKLAINLELELSLVVTLYSLTSKQIACHIPNAQLHPPPQIPEHTDSTERIDSNRTCSARHTTAMVLKVQRPRYTWHLFVLITSALPLRFAWPRRRRRLCGGGIAPFQPWHC